MDALLAETDVLIDGRFVEAERDLSLLFRGSRNQRLIDLKKDVYKRQVSEKMYKNAAAQQPQAGPDQGAAGGQQAPNGGNVYDAEYKDVDNNNNQ